MTAIGDPSAPPGRPPARAQPPRHALLPYIRPETTAAADRLPWRRPEDGR